MFVCVPVVVSVCWYCALLVGRLGVCVAAVVVAARVISTCVRMCC